MNTKFKRFILTAVSSLLLLALAACTAADVAPEGIKDALTSSSADGDGNSSPSVNYTDTSLSTNPLILSATGDMYYNPVLGPESFGNHGAWGEEAGFAGIADPYVLRFNGTYYLYCTTPYPNAGIKCFSSPDLVNWTDCGYCTYLTWGAYAPEVVYNENDGKFYMYTSASTNSNDMDNHTDHVVLVSDSPTGYFSIANSNLLGRNTYAQIDGHVFIDDDGTWYFFQAYEFNIYGYRMNSPTSVDTSTKTIVVPQMDGGGLSNRWTEGPFVIKHNGKYYLTYTGNHYLSEGYRINYAVADSPLGPYKELGDNPLLVRNVTWLSSDSENTESYENYDGLGHSSTVVGPNLDSYYIVYHALHRGYSQRNTRIDRLSFDGDYMYALDTTSSAAMPQMPHLYNYFVPDSNGNCNLSGWTTEGDVNGNVSVKNGILLTHGAKLYSSEMFGYSFTAECNFMYMPNGGRAGMIFGYEDGNNYGKAIFDRDNDTLTVTFVVDGKSTSYTISLVSEFGHTLNFGACQTLTVKRDGNEFTFLVNGREVGTTYNSSLGRGRIGAMSENDYVKVGFTAITPEVNGSSIKSDFKPVTSDKILATDCKETDYETISTDGQNAVIVENDDILNYYISVEKGNGNDWVSKAGAHDILFRYISYGNTTITVYQNKKKIGKFTLPDTGGVAKTEVIRNAFSLTEGCSVLTFCFDTERFIFSDFEMDKYEAVVTVTGTNDDGAGGLYTDGGWDMPSWDNWVRISNDTSSAGKKMFGSYNYGDYEVEVAIRFQKGSNAGVIVRGSNPSTNKQAAGDSGMGTSSLQGSNFYQGYFVFIDGNDVVLGKSNYNWTELTRAKCNPTTAAYPHNYNTFKVRVQGATITVWINGEKCIEYTDPYPFMQGAFGIRYLYTEAAFYKLTVKPI